MSNLPSVDFLASFVGDGVSTTVNFSMLTDPILLASGSSAVAVLSSAVSALPSGAKITYGGGLTISSQSFNAITKELSVTFNAAPVNGTEYTLSGTLTY